MYPLKLKYDVNSLELAVQFIWLDGMREGTTMYSQKGRLKDELFACMISWKVTKLLARCCFHMHLSWLHQQVNKSIVQVLILLWIVSVYFSMTVARHWSATAYCNCEEPVSGWSVNQILKDASPEIYYSVSRF